MCRGITFYLEGTIKKRVMALPLDWGTKGLGTGAERRPSAFVTWAC